MNNEDDHRKNANYLKSENNYEDDHRKNAKHLKKILNCADQDPRIDCTAKIFSNIAKTLF